jgi:KaiC/GvpD/RAD55 family RecA-like ATPase
MGEPKRIKTYVRGLDERIMGGIPAGYNVLIAGPSGSMKTSLVYSIVFHNVKSMGVKGMFISFEQNHDDIVDQMSSLGMDPKNLKDLNIVDLSEFRKETKDEEERMDWFEALIALLKRYKKEDGLDMVAIDSLDALYSLTHLPNPRKQLFHFFRELRELGVTTFVISEIPRGTSTFGKYDVEEFLSDGIIHLRIRELEVGQTTSVRRFMGVAKMRRTNHDTDYYPFLIIDNKFELVSE